MSWNIVFFIFIFLIKTWSGECNRTDISIRYLNFACGGLEQEVESLIKAYEVFKNEPDNLSTTSSPTLTTESQSTTSRYTTSRYSTISTTNRPTYNVDYFLIKSRNFRDTAIRQALEIEQEIIQLDWSDFYGQVVNQSILFECKNLKSFAESLAMEILAYSNGMFDINESFDPDTELELQMQYFFKTQLSKTDFASIQDSIDEYLSNLNKSEKPSILKMLTDTEHNLNQIRTSLLNVVVIPEMDRVRQIGKKFSIQDRVRIQSTLDFMGTIIEISERLKKEISVL